MENPLRKAYRAFALSLDENRRRRLRFLLMQRRLLHLHPPRSFSEKVVWRLLNDRRDELKWTCDKLAMKERIAALETAARPVPTVWSGTDLRELDHVELPERWVLKPNNRSARVHFGEGRPDTEALSAKTARWLDQETDPNLREWAYEFAQPVFIVEPWIGGVTFHDVPADYKLYLFDGDVAMVQVHSGRGGDHRVDHFGQDWSPIAARTLAPSDIPPARPERLDDLVAAASSIARGFDFMRVDFYIVGDTLYFGETTPYPGSGLRPIHPYSYDRELGARWKLPAEVR